jgi:hypothetical protein
MNAVNSGGRIVLSKLRTQRVEDGLGRRAASSCDVSNSRRSRLSQAVDRGGIRPGANASLEVRDASGAQSSPFGEFLLPEPRCLSERAQ